MIFDRYAQCYDACYRKKDYTKECGYLESLFRKYLKRKPVSILDLGCGTANHSIILARRGYRITGVDASKSMLAIAREKSRKAGKNLSFAHQNLKNFSIHKRFDAAICMFSVIDYILDTSAIKKTLKNIYGHLKPGSLFIFDFWNADAVVRHYSPSKKGTFINGHETIERRSRTKLFPLKQLCRVEYTCLLKSHGRVIDSIKERHTVRYFLIDDMKQFLSDSGFKIVNLHPFLNPNLKIRHSTWDVTIVAQKI